MAAAGWILGGQRWQISTEGDNMFGRRRGRKTCVPRERLLGGKRTSMDVYVDDRFQRKRRGESHICSNSVYFGNVTLRVCDVEEEDMEVGGNIYMCSLRAKARDGPVCCIFRKIFSAQTCLFIPPSASPSQPSPSHSPSSLPPLLMSHPSPSSAVSSVPPSSLHPPSQDSSHTSTRIPVPSP